MARPYRLQAENCLYHITSRGNERRNIFSDGKDYEKFLKYIGKAKERFRFFVYAYVLMPNHYHLFIETTQANLSKIMQYINTSYTVYYNLRYKRNGHLFQGRYKSIVVDKDNYFIGLTRYIHLNPVRAKLVKRPEQYKWSSYSVFIKEKGDEVIDKKQLGAYLNMDAKNYSNFVQEGLDKKEDFFKDIYGGFILGKSDFIEEKLTFVREFIKGGDFSYKREIRNRIEVNDVVKEVAKYYGKNLEELYTFNKRPVIERKIAVYLSRRLTGLTNNEIGKVFGISYSAVSKIVNNIEGLIEKNGVVRKDVAALISNFKV